MHTALSIALVHLASGALALGLYIAQPLHAQSSTEDDPLAASVSHLEESQSILWVDGRSLAEFEGQHAPGAIHLTLDNWDEGFMALLNAWDGSSTIIAYCSSTSRSSSRDIAEKIRRDIGIDTVYYYPGGWPSLQKMLNE